MIGKKILIDIGARGRKVISHQINDKEMIGKNFLIDGARGRKVIGQQIKDKEMIGKKNLIDGAQVQRDINRML